MIRTSRDRQRLSTLVAILALLIAGCGEEATTPTPSPTPTPAPAATPGTLVDNGGEQIADGGADGSTGTLTIPDLNGGDLAGGYTSDSSIGIFTPKAGDPVAEEDAATDGAQTDSFDSMFDTGGSTNTTSSTTAYEGASIYVDGVVHSVSRNGTFPKGGPVFRLLSVTATEIEIELVAGEFTSSGGTGLFLDKGKLVSLYNASERITYKVKYLRPVATSSSGSF